MLLDNQQLASCLLACLIMTMSLASTATPKKELQQEEFITTKDPVSFVYECHPAHWERADDSKSIEFNLNKIKKRCEIAVHNLLRRDKAFSLSFKFFVDDNYKHSSQWHSYFQIHSFPDEGESWRCPIFALETKNGKLRMYNRWDTAKISTTIKGTCAGEGNSIRSRTIFDNVTYKVDEWNSFLIQGVLSTSSQACVKTFLNGVKLKKSCGPNVFNDLRMPFFKLGIYKPTSWDSYDAIHLKVKDLKFE